MRGHGTVEKLRVKRFAYRKVETFFARGQRLEGFGKFTGDKANQGQFRGLLQRLVGIVDGLCLGLSVSGKVFRAGKNGNFFV